MWTVDADAPTSTNSSRQEEDVEATSSTQKKAGKIKDKDHVKPSKRQKKKVKKVKAKQCDRTEGVISASASTTMTGADNLGPIMEEEEEDTDGNESSDDTETIRSQRVPVKTSFCEKQWSLINCKTKLLSFSCLRNWKWVKISNEYCNKVKETFHVLTIFGVVFTTDVQNWSCDNGVWNFCECIRFWDQHIFTTSVNAVVEDLTSNCDRFWGQFPQNSANLKITPG